MTNPNPPIGTSANLLLKGSDGSYEIYNIGKNQILAAYNMGTTGTDLSGYNLIGLGSFNLPDNNDILYQSTQFPYLNSTFVNVSGNNITGTVNHSQDFALNTQTFDD